MKIAYIDAFSGISGDMFIGALLDAGLDERSLREGLSRLNLNGFELKIYKTQKGFIQGTRFEVTVNDSVTHRNLKDIINIIQEGDLKDEIKSRSIEIFKILAEAEGRVHGKSYDAVHFHEVGATDAIVDIVGAVIGLEIMGIKEVHSSGLPGGSGFVKCSHGIIPVPAPATIEICRNRIPMYTDERKGELVTPTGAAILAGTAKAFGSMPGMKIERTGHGAGARDSEIPNVLRIIIGESIEDKIEREQLLIQTNIDDMNPQIYGPLMEKLFACGALDVTLTPIYMKKQRPAITLSILSEQELEDRIGDILFRETTTIGYKKIKVKKRFLPRRNETVATPWGDVRLKITVHQGIERIAPEFDDCNRISCENDIPVNEIIQRVKEIYNTGSKSRLCRQ